MRRATSSVEPVEVPKNIPIEGDAKREMVDRIFVVIPFRSSALSRVFVANASQPSGLAMARTTTAAHQWDVIIMLLGDRRIGECDLGDGLSYVLLQN